MNAPLDGIYVLDFSEYIAGPYCGSLLADFGANVIKVEPPDGAEERRFGNQGRYKGNTRMSLTLNRGKRGMCVNLRTEEGRKVIHRLAERIDIVIQNFAPGIAQKLGIDYETLSKINKRLIFISSTAFGETGPYRLRKGFDIIAHAASGIMSAYADEDGVPRGPGGVAFIDMGTGMLNALGAMTALYSRTITGEGQKIETALFKTGMAFQAAHLSLIDKLDKQHHQEVLHVLQTAHQEGKNHTQIVDTIAQMRLYEEFPGSERDIEVPACNHRPSDRHTYPYYRIYETANGYIGIAALNRKQRETVVEVLGIKDESASVDVGEITDAIHFDQKRVMRRIEQRLKDKPNEHWIEALESAGVPCGPVNYSANLFYDPQVEAVDMIWELENSVMGKYKMTGNPIGFVKNPIKAGKGSPALGEHTIEILEEFGYSKPEIEELKKSQTIR